MDKLVIITLLLIFMVSFGEVSALSTTLTNDNSLTSKLKQYSLWSPIVSIYNKIKESSLFTEYGWIVLLILLPIIIWIIAIPSRIGIELAGRLIGENPDVSNFGALFLSFLMSINGFLGLIAFIIWFKDEMPLYKVFILAFLSMIIIGFLYIVMFLIILFLVKNHILLTLSLF